MRTQPIALLGGGRWGRIIVQVLNQILPANEKIIWVSHHGFAQNQAWLKENGLTERVSLHAQNEAIWSAAHTGGLIIASATPDHANHMARALNAGVPVFCEKPFALQEREANQLIALAAQSDVKAGVNFEFATAPFVQGFADVSRHLTLKNIALTWHDPEGETRHGERKRFDPRIPETQDGLPHCLSIFSALGVDLSTCQLDSVHRQQDDTVITQFTGPDLELSASLSRHAPERRRLVTLNQEEAHLDFTTEPGHAQINGKAQTLSWGPPGPMSVSLQSFLDQIEKPTNRWPLAIARWREAVILAEQATQALNETSGD